MIPLPQPIRTQHRFLPSICYPLAWRPLFFLIAIFVNQWLWGSSVVGGDLTTTWMGGSKYKIILTQYKTCASVSWNTSITQKIYCNIGKNGDSSCGSTSINIAYASVDTLTMLCTTAKSLAKCGGGMDRLIAYTYTAEIDLSKDPFKTQLAKSSCTELTFYAYGFKPRTGLLSYCASTDMWLTAKIHIGNLKNCSNTNNYGPVTLLPYYSIAQKYATNSFATGMVDTADRDLLSFRLKPVITRYSGNGNLTTCVATATGNPDVPLTPFCSPPSSNCAVNLKTYPSRGSWFDTVSGDYVVSPINDEITSFLIQINEYRRNKNGNYVLIAQHSREQSIISNGYTNRPPISSYSSPINLCVGDSICQTLFDASDNTTSVDDSLIFRLPWLPNYIKPQITRTNKLNVKYNYCVRPKISDTTDAPILVPIFMQDNNCSEMHRFTKTLVLRVSAKPEAAIETKYIGCNKIAISAASTNGKNFTINWQITQVGGSYLRVSSKKIDTFFAMGNGTYLIRHLLSNGTGCFTSKTDTVKITDNPASVKLSNKELFGGGFDTFSCKVNPYKVAPISITGKGPFYYQWYSTGYNQLIPGQTPSWTVNPLSFNKLSKDSVLTIKTNSDTSIYLEIKDVNGCIASAFQRLSFINSEGIRWKNNPLPSICHNQSELLLINETNKNLGAAAVRGRINSNFPAYLDSLGPDKFRFRTPPIGNNGNIQVEFYVNYDTVGCTSADTTQLTILVKPRFSLNSDTVFQCTQIPNVVLKNLIVSPAKEVKTYTWTPLKWPARVSKPLIFDAGSNGIQDIQMQNNSDSLPLGVYQIQACTIDTVDNCRWCDTAIVVSKPINKVVGTASEICPSEPSFLLHKKLFFNNKPIDSLLYSFKLFSVNYDTTSADFPINSMIGNRFHPRYSPGLFIIKAIPTQKCWSNSIVEISVLDTPAVSILTDPKDSALLPSATIYFEAKTNASRVRWDFGTGNASDTANVGSLNWAYDKKPAIYPVNLWAWGNNGCYGEAKINYVISQYNNLLTVDKSHGIDADLKVIHPHWKFQQLIVTDMNGRIIVNEFNNTGIANKSLTPGIYNYRIRYSLSTNPTEIRTIQGRYLQLPK